MAKRQHRILVIEDDSRLRTALVRKLEQEGYAVLAAADGEEGLEAAAEQPDLILLDLLMPKLDGREMLQQLRESDWGRRIPVIILTNDASTRSVNTALRAGAPAYFTKVDISLKEIIEAVRDHLRTAAPG